MVSFLIKAVKGLFKSDTYGSDLEKYIIRRQPQNTGDIERYTIEYHYRKDSFL